MAYFHKKLSVPGEQIQQICICQDEDILGRTKSGKVLMWMNFTSSETPKVKMLDHFIGIAISYVAVAPNANLVCMITHRGILMTKGM